MNLSNELIAHIGQLLRTHGDRRFALEWVRAIEADLREQQQREIDAERLPFILRRQAS